MHQILLFIILYLIKDIDATTTQIIRIASYCAVSLCSFNKLISLPGTFENILHIEPNVFL